MKTLTKILARILDSPLQSATQITSFGIVNTVYDVKTENGQSFIIRMNKEDLLSREYPKEKWCIEKARELGVPSPKVLLMGYEDGYSFMIQNKISGINGSLAKGRDEFIYQKLGEYCRLFSQIDIGIFGDGNPVDVKNEAFNSWEKHIDYNIGQLELGVNDPFIGLDVFSRSMQGQILELFKKLKHNEFSIGLVHGDLRPANTIVNGDEVFLIDWGTAEFHFQPFTELSLLYFETKLEPTLLTAFLKGMKISPTQFEDLLPEMSKFHLLKRIDKLRWAIDRHPPIIPKFVEKIKNAISHGKNLGVL